MCLWCYCKQDINWVSTATYSCTCPNISWPKLTRFKSQTEIGWHYPHSLWVIAMDVKLKEPEMLRVNCIWRQIGYLMYNLIANSNPEMPAGSAHSEMDSFTLSAWFKFSSSSRIESILYLILLKKMSVWNEFEQFRVLSSCPENEKCSSHDFSMF